MLHIRCINITATRLLRTISTEIRYTEGRYAPPKDIVPDGALIYDFEQRQKAPLVCLLGWLGANWRHLSKFSSWYSACNIPTLATIARTPSVVLPHLAHSHVKQYITRIENEHEQDRSIILHTLSGNGLLFMGRIIHDEQVRTHNSLLTSSLKR